MGHIHQFRMLFHSLACIDSTQILPFYLLKNSLNHWRTLLLLFTYLASTDKSTVTCRKSVATLPLVLKKPEKKTCYEAIEYKSSKSHPSNIILTEPQRTEAHLLLNWPYYWNRGICRRLDKHVIQ